MQSLIYRQAGQSHCRLLAPKSRFHRTLTKSPLFPTPGIASLKSDNAPASQPVLDSFNQTFASLYADDPAAGLAYFLDTCQIDSRQFFRAEPTARPAYYGRSEQLLRSYAHALCFQKNPVQALIIGDHLISYLSKLALPALFGLIAQIGNDLSSLSALSSNQRGVDLRADRRRDALKPFWCKFSQLIRDWGPIAPPLYSIKPKRGHLHKHAQRPAEALYLDMWSLDQAISPQQLQSDLPSLYCFDSAFTLLQALSRKLWLNHLIERPKLCGFWVLDEDLEGQIEAQRPFFSQFELLQEPFAQWETDLEPTLIKNAMRRAGALWRAKAEPGFRSSKSALMQQQMREQNFALTALILGWDSLLAVGLARDSAHWFSANSTVSSASGPLNRWIEQMLEQSPRVDIERKNKSGKRLRLIHIVSQLVDTCHSPTQLLRQLIEHRSASAFDVFVMSAERLTPRAGQYPQLERTSSSSLERGKKMRAWLIEKGISVDYLSSQVSWAEGLAQWRAQIAKLKPDILTFHGPDLIHLELARSFDEPLKVLFEHGSLPQFRGFDLVIASTEDSPHLFGQRMKALATEIIALPFCSDRRSQWAPNSVGKADLGLSDGAFAAITISNHLDKRLSPQFCQAISSILGKCPNMHYVPIGPVAHLSNLKERFKGDVRDRIRLYGPSPSPANLARAADLYFNEFPWGGCLGILDALAAGCPVVSMYDDKGPAQARYGGLLMGDDFAILSNDQKQYVDVACRLYKEPLFYFKASQRAFIRYEGRSNAPAYVREFEAIVAKARKDVQ